VGDEQRGEPLVQEQPQQLLVEPFTGDLADGAERLVEEEELGVERE
jgi:hypothetical protein